MAPTSDALARATVVPASAPWLGGEDALRLTVFNGLSGVTVTLSGRLLLDDGTVSPFLSTLVPATDRTASSLTVPMACGWLLGASVIVTAGAPQHGQTFAVLSLVRGRTGAAIDLETLGEGFITAQRRIAVPWHGASAPLYDDGALRSIAGTSPGAGVEITETVPTGALWKLQSFQTTLTTSAVAANRVPSLVIDDGTNEIGRFPMGVNETASKTNINTWAQGLPRFADLVVGAILSGLPNNLVIGPGYRLRTVTALIDAGDAYTAIRYSVRELVNAT